MTRKNGNNEETSKQDKSVSGRIDDTDFLRSLVQTFLQEYLEAEIAKHSFNSIETAGELFRIL